MLIEVQLSETMKKNYPSFILSEIVHILENQLKNISNMVPYDLNLDFEASYEDFECFQPLEIL